jgi:hypothetical protein
MANNSDSRTAIIVALITVAGTVTVGLLTNWDKVFAPFQPSAPTTSSTGTVALTDTFLPNGTQTPGPQLTTARGASIAGLWRDDDDFDYLFKVHGTKLTYLQSKAGKEVGSAVGSIEGRTLRYAYQSRAEGVLTDSGNCHGVLADDGRAIEGICRNGKHSWGFKIVRATAQ